MPRDVFVPLVRLNASAFILVHNHPSKDPRPSRDDLLLTNSVARVGKTLGILLLDHLIVGGSEIASLNEMGLIPSGSELGELEAGDDREGQRTEAGAAVRRPA